jgi:acyl-CoA dehydrogenase
MFDVPEEYEGAGLGSLAQVVVWEQMCRSIALPSCGRGIFGPEIRPILYALNDEQKKRFLYPFLREDKDFASCRPNRTQVLIRDENPRGAPG